MKTPGHQILCLIALLIALSARPAAAQSARLKDIARVQAQRSNQLFGVGLVVGLAGTGDGQQSPQMIQMFVSVLQAMGITLDSPQIRPKNLAAVIVTAEIPAFAKNGDRLDVTVSAAGDSKSLQGGTLLQTPLYGADGKVYALSQGPVSLGGFSAGQGGNSVTQNHPAAGRIPGGAIVEEEIPAHLEDIPGVITVNLLNPDFNTAVQMAAAINHHFGGAPAHAIDNTSVRILVPSAYQNRLVTLIAEMGDLVVTPDSPARIVINERTGTVVIGAAVRILPVAIAHSNLTVDIQRDFLVSQPPPLTGRGAETVVVPQDTVQAAETPAEVAELNAGVTLGELVKALNALRMTARDIVAILQAIKDAGALQGELVLQ